MTLRPKYVVGATVLGIALLGGGAAAWAQTTTTTPSTTESDSSGSSGSTGETPATPREEGRRGDGDCADKGGSGSGITTPSNASRTTDDV